jgi:hypothetical protein
MRQPTKPATKADNPRLRMVRIDIGGDARNYTTGQQRVTVVPLTIRRKQNRKVMIPPPGDDSILGAGGHDLPMIRMLGKAFYWQRLLDEGRYPAANDLARSLKLEPGWVAEVLRLTTLAPDIIESVLDGRQPRDLNLHTLRGRRDQLPRDWGEQRKAMGFAN